MGAVHGCYLKYVGLSAISYAGYQLVVGNIGPMESLSVGDARILATSSGAGGGGGRGGYSDLLPLLRLGTATYLGYSTLLNGTIAILFKMKKGMGVLGKNLEEGSIPLWSYLLFSPFHIPTYAYTYVHTLVGKMKVQDGSSKKKKKSPVPVASMVQPGLWVGGCFAHRLNKQWAGIIDLTVEFPERCRDSTLKYLCVPTWDGVPCSPEQLEHAANFAVEAKENWMKLKEQGAVEGEPNILIHCAHGRGRSTTVMCAAMVKMGMYANFEEALEKGIKPGRPVCKLNAMMRKNLTEWQNIYVEGKKGL
ncbi:dual specificity phosphatase [Skeletonema marinoi]|uniref:Dual specificity phosphatase n=1 Tax=Skeletonema marinoi TaxID=267567 RepID=A0AAD9DAY2_9STRA|nr:dual specificity phosphatase [Skeletonema marinoi]